MEGFSDDNNNCIFGFNFDTSTGLAYDPRHIENVGTLTQQTTNVFNGVNYTSYTSDYLGPGMGFSGGGGYMDNNTSNEYSNGITYTKGNYGYSIKGDRNGLKSISSFDPVKVQVDSVDNEKVILNLFYSQFPNANRQDLSKFLDGFCLERDMGAIKILQSVYETNLHYVKLNLPYSASMDYNKLKNPMISQSDYSKNAVMAESGANVRDVWLRKQKINRPTNSFQSSVSSGDLEITRQTDYQTPIMRKTKNPLYNAFKFNINRDFRFYGTNSFDTMSGTNPNPNNFINGSFTHFGQNYADFNVDNNGNVESSYIHLLDNNKKSFEDGEYKNPVLFENNFYNTTIGMNSNFGFEPVTQNVNNIVENINGNFGIQKSFFN